MVGASVWSATHSGIPTVVSPKWTASTALRTVEATYVRSRRGERPRDASALPEASIRAASPATLRRRPISGTVPRMVIAPTSTTVRRYAIVLSATRASPASRVPMPMRTFITTRSRARTATRSGPTYQRASIVIWAVLCRPRVAETQAATRTKLTTSPARAYASSEAPFAASAHCWSRSAPHRSLSRPPAYDARTPTPPARVRPIPTTAGDRPTPRVKYRALTAKNIPRDSDIAATAEASARSRGSRRSSGT
jgi:hypothetical protein